MVYGLAWSHAGLLAAACLDGRIRVRETDVDSVAGVLQGHEARVLGVAWAGDGRLASASLDGTVRVWDVDAGREICIITGHEGPVQKVAWNPAGTRLASASADGTVRVWDAESGRELVRFEHERITVFGSPVPPEVHANPDAAIRDEGQDVFGHSDYADALVALLEHERTKKPLTIAVNAPWGTGKSSLANLMQKKLDPAGWAFVEESRGQSWWRKVLAWRRRRGQRRRSRRNHIVVPFNAWMHDEGEALEGAFLKEIARAANRRRPRWRRALQPVPLSILHRRQQVGRMVTYALSVASLLLALTYSLMAFVGVDVASWTRDALSSGGDYRAVLKAVGLVGTSTGAPALLRKVLTLGGPLASFANRADRETRDAGVERARSDLGRLIDQATPKGKSFVVFVDDLERCRPPNAVGVLEAIKHLLASERVVVVLLADLEKVATHVEMQYHIVARHDTLQRGGAHERVEGVLHRFDHSTAAAPSPVEQRVWVEQRSQLAGSFGARYIQKMVQLQVDLPPGSQDGMLRLVEKLTGLQLNEARAPVETGEADSANGEDLQILTAQTNRKKVRLTKEALAVTSVLFFTTIAIFVTSLQIISADRVNSASLDGIELANEWTTAAAAIAVAAMSLRLFVNYIERRRRERENELLSEAVGKIKADAEDLIDESRLREIGYSEDEARERSEALNRTATFRVASDASTYFRDALHRAQPHLQRVPRSAVRHVNRLRFLLYMAFKRHLFGRSDPGIGNDVRLGFLPSVKAESIGLWSVLLERWPELGVVLLQNPEKAADLRAAALEKGHKGNVGVKHTRTRFQEIVAQLAPSYQDDAALLAFFHDCGQLPEDLPKVIFMEPGVQRPATTAAHAAAM